jgi:titin
VSLAWNLPVTNGGASVSDYLVQRSPDGQTWTTVDDGVSTNRSAVVGGLLPGSTYWFRVAAVNPAGAGAFTNAQSATLPRTVPAAPVLSVTPQNAAVSLAWTSPANGGSAVTDFVIQRSKNGITWTTLSDGRNTKVTYVAKYLTNGTSYRFRVAAKNALGQGAWSIVMSTTPRKPPGTPRLLTAVRGNQQVTLSWKAPLSSGGAPVTDYRIQVSLEGKVWMNLNDGVSTATTFTVTGLTNGVKYWFRVAAINAAGVGTNTFSTTATPRAS